jgi:hypothetical protein
LVVALAGVREGLTAIGELTVEVELVLVARSDVRAFFGIFVFS